MGTIADKLNYALGTKTAIKNAIIEKGQTITNETFRAYAQKILDISGGGGSASINWYCPKICIGDPKVTIHSDCELRDAISASDYEISNNITSVTRIDKLNMLFTLDTQNMIVGDTVDFKGKSSIYYFNNGSATDVQKQIEIVGARDTYEDITVPIYLKRDILSRMTTIRSSYLDSGTITLAYTRTFRGVGYKASSITTIAVDANSIITAGNLIININQQDAGVTYIWQEEGACDNIGYMKLRWKGHSYFSNPIDQEYEVIFLTNGDVILHMVQLGNNPGGTYNFYGTSYSIATGQTICFYRQEYYGTIWNAVVEEYNYAHHVASSENLLLPGTLTNHSAILNDGVAAINNVQHDDDTVGFDFELGFTWHGNSRIYVGGNSFFGIGAANENIRMHRIDSKLYYLYIVYLELTDLNNLKAAKFGWRGSSNYRGAIDRWWTLWLFENGDAMIYVSTVGSYTGTSSFYDQSYTANNNSYISFYYNSTAGNYDIKYELYTLDHHIG